MEGTFFLQAPRPRKGRSERGLNGDGRWKKVVGVFPSSSSHPASSNSVHGARGGGCRAREEKRERGSRNHEQVQGTRHHVARINDSRPRRRYEARKHFPFFSLHPPRPITIPPRGLCSSPKGKSLLGVVPRSRLILFERLFFYSFFKKLYHAWKIENYRKVSMLVIPRTEYLFLIEVLLIRFLIRILVQGIVDKRRIVKCIDV